MSGGAEDGMAREYDPAVYRKGLAEIKENMSLDAFVAWGEGMIAAIEVLAKRLEAATDALREIVALHDEGHAECFSSAASDYAEIARAVVGA